MKPLIWIESVIEKFSHSRVEIMVKVPTVFFNYICNTIISLFINILCHWRCVLWNLPRKLVKTRKAQELEQRLFLLWLIVITGYLILVSLVCSLSTQWWYHELPNFREEAFTRYPVMLCCILRQKDNLKNSLWQIMWRWGSLSPVMLTHPSSKPAQAAPNMCLRRTWWCGPSSLSL